MAALRNITRRISIRQLSSCPPLTNINFTCRYIEQPFVIRTASYHVSSPRLNATTTDEIKNDNNDDDSGSYDREFVEMKVEDFKDLYENEPENRELIQTILNEYDYLKYNSLGRVPSVIEVNDMQRLIEEGTSPHSRTNLINFFFKREMDKRATVRRREQTKKETRERREAKFSQLAKSGAGTRRSGLLSDQGDILYGLWHNSLFCRIPENKLKAGSSASRLRNAALFGRKLIFDFGFEDYMAKWTYRNAVDQVQESYGLNRFHYKDPFDLWFCNFQSSSYGAEYCEKKAITNLRSHSMITVKEDCFTNHFDKSRLVYLSPNAREPLGKIHKSDDIYIIGVYNDKGNHQPVTIRKATKLGIRAKCLPIDSHVVWSGSTKSLCVNHVTGILLEVMANGGDWQAAFTKHVPSRKIKPLEMVMEEEQRRLANIRTKKRAQQFSIRDDLD